MQKKKILQICKAAIEERSCFLWLFAHTLQTKLCSLMEDWKPTCQSSCICIIFAVCFSASVTTLNSLISFREHRTAVIIKDTVVLHLNALHFEDEFRHHGWDVRLIEDGVSDTLQQRFHGSHAVHDHTPAQESLFKLQKHYSWAHLKENRHTCNISII